MEDPFFNHIPEAVGNMLFRLVDCTSDGPKVSGCKGQSESVEMVCFIRWTYMACEEECLLAFSETYLATTNTVSVWMLGHVSSLVAHRKCLRLRSAPPARSVWRKLIVTPLSHLTFHFLSANLNTLRLLDAQRSCSTVASQTCMHWNLIMLPTDLAHSPPLSTREPGHPTARDCCQQTRLWFHLRTYVQGWCLHY